MKAPTPIGSWARAYYHYAAGCEFILSKLEDGFDTLLGSGGVTLSGGQAQRIHGSCGTLGCFSNGICFVMHHICNPPNSFGYRGPRGKTKISMEVSRRSVAHCLS